MEEKDSNFRFLLTVHHPILYRTVDELGVDSSIISCEFFFLICTYCSFVCLEYKYNLVLHISKSRILHNLELWPLFC